MDREYDEKSPGAVGDISSSATSPRQSRGGGKRRHKRGMTANLKSSLKSVDSVPLMDTNQALHLLDVPTDLGDVQGGFEGEIQVTYLQEDEKGSEERTIDYKMDSRLGNWESHLKTIHGKFNITGSPPSHFILEYIDENKKRKIITEKEIGEGFRLDGHKFNFANQEKAAEKSVARLRSIVDKVSQSETNGKLKDAKDALWFREFESELQGEIFTNTFVKQDGMQLLFSFMDQSSSANVTKMAVNCLYAACEFPSPLEYIQKTEGAVESLYTLIYKDSLKLCNAVVEFMFLLAAKEGFEFVHNAITKVDVELEKNPYQRIVECFQNNKDIDLNQNALVFCNIMLQEANDEQKEQFLGLLDAVDLQNYMNECKTTTETYINNLDQFRVISGRPVPAQYGHIAALTRFLMNANKIIAKQLEQKQDCMRREVAVKVASEHLDRMKKAIREAEANNLIPDFIKKDEQVQPLIDMAYDRQTLAKRHQKEYNLERSRMDAEKKEMEEKTDAAHSNIVNNTLKIDELQAQLNGIDTKFASLASERKSISSSGNDENGSIGPIRKQIEELTTKIKDDEKAVQSLLKKKESFREVLESKKKEAKEKLEAALKIHNEKNDKLGKLYSERSDLKEMAKSLEAKIAAGIPVGQVPAASGPVGIPPPPGAAMSAGGIPPPPGAGGFPPIPGAGGVPPPPGAGGFPPIPGAGGIPPPPGADGFPPIPSAGGVPPPPGAGMIPPPPGGGGIPPPPGAGGIPPPPGAGGIPPPPGMGGIPPPPGMGGLPPPPGMGGLPPPPGLGLPGAMPTVRKDKPVVTRPKIQPKSKMMALYWKKINLPGKSYDKQKTCWRKMGLEDVPIDEEELINLFSKKKTAKKKEKKSTKDQSSKKKKKQKVVVLDPKVSKAVGILLRSGLPPVDVVKKNIASMKGFDEDKLTKVMNNLPTPSDIKAIKSEKEQETKRGGDPEKINWAPPEKYFIMLNSIPLLKPRLNCWIFSFQFEENVKEASKDLTIISDTCKELQEGKRLNALCAMILTCGNYMNGGRKGKERADGFHYSFLTRLKGTKSNDKKSNLLSYIVLRCLKKDPGFREIKKDFEALMSSSSVPELEEAKGRVFKIQNQFSMRKKESERVAQNSVKDAGVPDNFGSNMRDFFEKNQKRVTELKELYTKTAARFSNLVQWFGDGQTKPKRPVKSTEFFAVFREFITQTHESLPKPERKRGAKIGVNNKQGGGSGGDGGKDGKKQKSPVGGMKAIISAIKAGPGVRKGLKKKGIKTSPEAKGKEGQLDLAALRKGLGNKKKKGGDGRKGPSLANDLGISSIGTKKKSQGGTRKESDAPPPPPPPVD